LATLQQVLVDPDVLWLCQQILRSGEGILADAYDMVYFPGDDLFAIHRARGLPIGNLTSQFWANVFLNPLDHFIRRELKLPAYLRYVDDFLLFADDKASLWQARTAVIDHLAERRLTLHETRCQPRPVSEGIPFWGFVVYADHLRLKRRKGITFARHLRGLLAAYYVGEQPLSRVTAAVQSWAAHTRYAQSYGLRRAMLSRRTIQSPRSPPPSLPQLGGGTGSTSAIPSFHKRVREELVATRQEGKPM
jgi:hypothetical protein